MIQDVNIGGRLIGNGQSCYVIAEAGVNHNGEMDIAHQLIDAAVASGADCVKFQSYVTEELVTQDTPKAAYQVETTGAGGSQYDMLKALELSAEQQRELKAHCDEKGILYLCTPYDYPSADLLDEMDVAAYKIASTDTTNVPFLRYLAQKGRPVILSTGMSTMAEVEQAVDVLKSGGLEGKIVILHCTSEYPVQINEVNLRAMATMQQAFACPVGFSDHTQDLGASPWAVAVGACMIEKHFSLDRDMVGPDHRTSLEPQELKNLVQVIRDVQGALGDGIKRPMPSELPNKPRMQKSLVAARKITAGEKIVADALACKRPGTALPPHYFDQVVGREALKDIDAGAFITLDAVVWGD